MSVEHKIVVALVDDNAALQEEIKELKAQTMMVIAELERVDKMVSIAPTLYPTLIDIRHRIEALRKTTPQQCLASVKVESFKAGVISMSYRLVNEQNAEFMGGESQIAAIAKIVINEIKSKG